MRIDNLITNINQNHIYLAKWKKNYCTVTKNKLVKKKWENISKFGKILEDNMYKTFMSHNMKKYLKKQMKIHKR